MSDLDVSDSDVSDVEAGGARASGGAARGGWLRRIVGRLRGHDLRALMLYASMPGLSAVNAVVGLLLPALLGPVEFGHYAIAVTLFQYGLILDLGLSQLMDRRLPVLLAADEHGRLQDFADQVLWVRLYVAGAALLGGAVLLYALDFGGRLPFAPLPGLLSLAAGLAFMLALGPMAVWRATARRAEFARWSAACAIILAAGRPLGLLAGGLAGCFGTLAAAYAVLAVRLQSNMPLRPAQRPGLRQSGSLLAMSAPLFATSFVWAFYMTANRWVVSFLAGQVELGHFAFGANIVTLIVGTVGALAQLHYPAIVSSASSGEMFAVSRRLTRDLCWLAFLVALPTAVGILAGPRLIDVFYPTFAGSEAPVRFLLVAVPSLVVASWLMPLSLSAGARPWVEGIVIYPSVLLLLVLGTWAGFRLGGNAGAAWGLVGSSVPLVVLQLGNLRLIGLLTLADAGRILLLTVAGSALLAALALLS